MMQVPFVGNLNTVFVVAIGLGMLIILLTMVLNIYNSVKEHNTERPGLIPMVLPGWYFTVL